MIAVFSVEKLTKTEQKLKIRFTDIKFVTELYRYDNYKFYYFCRPAPNGPSENPVFTLFYFNVKALAEPIRFLFAYGGQEYEDVRVTRDEWPALKPSKLL